MTKRYTAGEEIFNAITHGIGAALSISALVILIVRALSASPPDGKRFYVIGFAMFGISLFILYLMSTLYHALTPLGAKKLFAVFDHSSIYLLIAGTYTPFCLTALRGGYGWTLFGVIWGIAAAGIVLYAVFGSRIRALSVITYLIMSWFIVFPAKRLYHTLPRVSLVLLFAGGGAYSVGCVFYALKKKWLHSVWHLFVLAGSACHFFSVYFSVQ